MKPITVYYIFVIFIFLGSKCNEAYAQKKNNNLDKVEQTQPEKLDGAKKASPIKLRTTVQGGIFRNFFGGVKTGSDYMGRVHITLGFDTENLGLWKKGEFFINGVNAHGGIPTSTFIGDFQPISRNEATQRTGLFELWYRHTFGNVSVLVGQHDMNSSFGTSNYGGYSINSAFGMYPSVTPNAGQTFSIYPRTMPAIYVRYDSDNITIQGAIYAGSSEAFDKDPYNTRWKLNESRLLVGEVHYKNIKNGVQRGIYKLGIVHHSGQFTDIINNINKIDGNLGIYLIAEQLLTQESMNKNQGLGLFLQLGSAQGNQNLIDFYKSFGMVYKGLFPKRDKDTLFLGFVNSSMNDELLEVSTLTDSRSILELNYAINLGEHLIIQPDLQYILNPGADPLLNNSFLGVLRFSVQH